jgi:hypothetical protein
MNSACRQLAGSGELGAVAGAPLDVQQQGPDGCALTSSGAQVLTLYRIKNDFPAQEYASGAAAAGHFEVERRQGYTLLTDSRVGLFQIVFDSGQVFGLLAVGGSSDRKARVIQASVVAIARIIGT